MSQTLSPIWCQTPTNAFQVEFQKCRWNNREMPSPNKLRRSTGTGYFLPKVPFSRFYKAYTSKELVWQAAWRCWTPGLIGEEIWMVVPSGLGKARLAFPGVGRPIWIFKNKRRAEAHTRSSTRPRTAVCSLCCSNLDRQRKLAKGWMPSDKSDARRSTRLVGHGGSWTASPRRDPEANWSGAAKSCKADIRVKRWMTSALGTGFEQ